MIKALAASPPTPAILLVLLAPDVTTDSNFTSVFTLTAAGARCWCSEGCAGAAVFAFRLTRAADATPRDGMRWAAVVVAVAGRAEGGRVLLIKADDFQRKMLRPVVVLCNNSPRAPTLVKNWQNSICSLHFLR